MKLLTKVLVPAIASGLLAGCGSSEPTQPKLTDSQVQEVMQKAKGQNQKESGGRRGGGMGPGGAPR